MNGPLHWSVRVLLMLFGAQALQNSILVWASQHRTHHRRKQSTNVLTANRPTNEPKETTMTEVDPFAPNKPGERGALFFRYFKDAGGVR